jgi:hypothetical protein
VDLIALSILLALFAPIWRLRDVDADPRGARRGEITYEGRVHGGGREFILTPTGDGGELCEPVEVRVGADWAQEYIHDGDRLQIKGKWKKQFWKNRSWVEAKQVYNFTTGANWDRKSGVAAGGN